MGYNFFKITELKDSFRQKLNTFVATLGSAIGNGTKISFADNDISYVLQLQNERLKNKGLTVDYEIYDRDSRRDAMVPRFALESSKVTFSSLILLYF